MIRDLLLQKPALAGTFCTLASIEALEVLCYSGADFVIVDAQHGAFTQDEMRHALRAADAAGVTAIARLPANGAAWIEGLLDAGYGTLLAPMVNSAREAAELVRATHYPPLGVRSQSSCRAMLRDSSYRENFNATFELLVMIEHADAVAEVESISQIPGVAGCFYGGTDLASSYRAQLPHGFETVESALAAARARVVAATRAAGKLAGIAASDARQAKQYREEGFQLITVSSDRNLLRGAIESSLSEWSA